MRSKRNAMAALMAAFLLSTLSVAAFGKTDPYMKSTRTQLMKARACLIAGEDDKGGHRNQAINYLYTAIAEVEAALKAKNHHARVTASEAFAAAKSVVPTIPRNNIEQALIHLKQAKDNMGAAAPDAGGHRAKAIELIDKAIVEVEKAIARAP
jgi:hypothetical protein